MKTFYSSTVDEVIKELKSDATKGLSYKGLQDNLDTYGFNKIELNIKSSAFKNSFKFRDIYLLIIVIFLAIIFEKYIYGLISIVIVLTILSYKYILFRKKREKTLQLESLNYTDVSVIRAGVKDKVKADVLTVGDIVFLEKGNIISADIRIIEENNLFVNERNITSSDIDVRKYNTRIDRVKSLSEINNMVFRGTRVTKGYGKGIVVGIGNETQIGKLLDYVKVSDLRSKIIGETLAYDSRFISKLTLIVAFIATVILFLVDSKIAVDTSMNIWFLAATLNVSMSELGYKFLKKKEFQNAGITFEDMSQLERFDNIDVFFIPKIGAITEAKMNLKVMYTSDKYIDKVDNIDIKNVNIERMINIGILNNDASFQRQENKYKGSLIDGAVLEFCNKKNIFKPSIIAKYPSKFNIPFEAQKGISTSVNKVKNGYRASIKGFVDDILDRCKYIMIDGMEREITEQDIEKIRMIDFNISNKAYTTIGFAYRSFNYEPSEDENIESNLVFVGIAGFENPIKENANEMIEKLKKQKILPIMITDDNKIVATRCAIELGIAKGMEEVISGVELLSLEKNELIEVLSRIKVLCRITPAIKSKIISIFTEDNYGIAATGENLSDMPSVILADIGITTGERPAKLLEKLGNIGIKDEILDKFLNLIVEGRNLSESLGKAFKHCKGVFIFQILILLYCGLALNINSAFKLNILILNTLILPSILMHFFFNELEEEVSVSYIGITGFLKAFIYIGSLIFFNEFFEIKVLNMIFLHAFMLIPVLVKQNIIDNKRNVIIYTINIVMFLINIGL
ncbi:MAG: cation-transporting P-type ATPase, partial [Sarcina sp.]